MARQAVFTSARVARLMGTINVPLLLPPYLPIDVGTWSFLPGSLWPVAFQTFPNSGSLLTAIDCQIFTPFSKWISRYNVPPTVTGLNHFRGWHGQWGLAAIQWTVSGTQPVLGYRAPIPIGANRTFQSVNGGYVLYNPLLPSIDDPAGNGSSVDALNSISVCVEGDAFHGYHYNFLMVIRNGVGGVVKDLLFYPIHGGDYLYRSGWNASVDPVPVLFEHNVPVVIPYDPLTQQSANYNSFFVKANGGALGVQLGLWNSLTPLQLINVTFEEAALNTVFGTFPYYTGASQQGHLMANGTVPYLDNGTTAIVLSPDGNEYYRVRFTAGAGNAAIMAAVATDYIFKFDPFGVAYLKRSNDQANVYTSAGLHLTINMPTGGLQPVSLPCWTPCIPAQFLGKGK